MTRYAIAKIVKEVETFNFTLYTIISHYNETFTIWRSNNDMPYLHGANSFDIYIVDEQYSRDYINNGHCKEYDMFKLKESWIYISSYILGEVQKQVTEEQFTNLMVNVYKQSASDVRGHTLLLDHKKSNIFMQIEFATPFDKMQYDIKYCDGDMYNEIRHYLPKNIRTLVNINQ
jgi:hypothetical protein